jgi:PEP-CTERM motif
MRTFPSLLVFAGLITASAHLAAQDKYVIVSLEQFNYQTNTSTVSPVEYTAFASIEGFAGVTGTPTVTVNGGSAINLPQDPGIPGLYEVQDDEASSGALTALYPTNVNYEFNFTQSSLPKSVTITGPGGTFSSQVPFTPVFTIAGATGNWSSGFQGIGVFTVNSVTNGTSFTVTLNAYNRFTAGGNYGFSTDVADISSGYSKIEEFGNGPVPDTTPSTTTTLTFFLNGTTNNTDNVPLTYDFGSGTNYEIEGGFSNIFNLGATGLGDGSQEAFIFGNYTAFQLVAGAAIPEPSTYGALLGSFALAGALLRRRRRA